MAIVSNGGLVLPLNCSYNKTTTNDKQRPNKLVEEKIGIKISILAVTYGLYQALIYDVFQNFFRKPYTELK